MERNGNKRQKGSRGDSPKPSIGTPEVDGDRITYTAQVDGETRRAQVRPAARLGLWAVELPDEPNPYERALSSGYGSQDEAARAAQHYLLTGRPKAPKGEPRPLWLDPDGAWEVAGCSHLWPMVPSALLVELRRRGADGEPRSGGVMIRDWELKGGVRAILDRYEAGEAQRVSIVERRLMPPAMVMQLKAQVSLAMLGGVE